MQEKSLRLRQLITLCQDKGEGNGRVREGVYAWRPAVDQINTSQLSAVHHRPSLNIHVPRLEGPLEGSPYKPCRPLWDSGVEPREKCEVRRKVMKRRGGQPSGLSIRSSPLQPCSPSQTTERVRGRYVFLMALFSNRDVPKQPRHHVF